MNHFEPADDSERAVATLLADVGETANSTPSRLTAEEVKRLAGGRRSPRRPQLDRYRRPAWAWLAVIAVLAAVLVFGVKFDDPFDSPCDHSRDTSVHEDIRRTEADYHDLTEDIQVDLYDVYSNLDNVAAYLYDYRRTPPGVSRSGVRRPGPRRRISQWGRRKHRHQPRVVDMDGRRGGRVRDVQPPWVRAGLRGRDSDPRADHSRSVRPRRRALHPHGRDA